MTDFKPAADIEDEIRELYALSVHNRALYEEAVCAHDVAARYRTQYRRIVDSRGIKVWFEHRRKKGEKVTVLDVAVPDLPVDEPADLRAEAKAFEESVGSASDACHMEGCDPCSQDCPWYRQLALGGVAIPCSEEEQEGIYQRIAAEQRAARQLARSIDDCYRVATRYKKAYQGLTGSRYYRAWEKRLRRRGLEVPSFDEEDLKRKNAVLPPGVAAGKAEPCSEGFEEVPNTLEAPSYYARSEARVGIIAREADWRRYKDAARCVRVSPARIDAALEGGIDLLLVFSVDAKQVDLAVEAVSHAKGRGVPVAFVGSGDPAACPRCLPIAREADFVFTADAPSADRYKRELGLDEVHVLGPAFNPLLHNPVGRAQIEQSDDVLLACDWPAGKGRAPKAAETVVDGVLEAGAGLVAVEGFSGGVPAKYSAHRVPAMSSTELATAERLHRFAACVDAPQTSPTALSARAFELEASGCIVLSSYSLSASNVAPERFTILDSSEAGRILSGYTEDELLALSAEGVRRAFDGNTAYNRMGEILTVAGLVDAPTKKPVHVIVGSVDDASRGFLEAQSLDDVELVAEADAGALTDGYAVRLSEPRPDSPWLLEDLLDAFKYTDADWVACAPAPELAYSWAEDVKPEGPAMVDLSKVSAAALLSGELPEGSKGFLVPVPRWGRTTSAAPKELAVIMPIYNNGRYLWGRSFRSLLRSSVFERMQVYLMDDGSTDGETERIVSWIAGRYDNVTTHFFGDGGSGSPSRPRNKGLELAREPYVTFLDPDNEAVEDGYATLLDDARSDGADLIYCTWLCVDAKASVARWAFAKPRIRKHAPGQEPVRVVEDPAAELVRLDFTVMNPQSCVIRRGLIEDIGLSFLEGAAAEDTLFCYELLLNAHIVRSHDLDASVYWSEREGSLTNALGADFFHRVYLCHEQQSKLLREHGLIDAYCEERLQGAVDGWLRNLLTRVPVEELPEAATYIRNIRRLYTE